MDTSPACLPIFPLKTVLFPGGLLPLRVFEPRYMDMASRCLRDQSSFGVCLIDDAAGGDTAALHPVGTEARIETWDMDEPGILSIIVRGVRRFRIENHAAGHASLLSAQVRWLAEPAAAAVPAAQVNLLPLLRTIAAGQGRGLPPPHRFDDAAWVGARYAELLPVPLLAKQRLLELDDMLSRLEIIQQYLRQHGLLEGGS